MNKKIVIKYEGALCSINNMFEISRYPAKATKRHYRLLSSDYRTCKEAISWAARFQCPNVVFNPGDDLKFTIEFWYPRGVDSDAFIKGAKDALTGIVYSDDKLVSEDHTKRHIEKGCIVRAIITVEQIGDIQESFI